jgi:hypothetical protein
MDNRPRSQIKQKDARRKKFAHNQYWCVSYTECPKSGLERDFKTIIKARSAPLATAILLSRLKEDGDFLKIRSVTISMVHKCWHIADLRKQLTIHQWESIRNVSFPNDWNRLFKFEKKRVKEQTNRFNVPPTILSPEHKKKLRDAANALVDKYIRGTFKPLCPALKKECNAPTYKAQYGQRRGFASLQNERQSAQEVSYLKKIMKECHGNIQWAADTLGIGRTAFYRALRRFPDVDWKSEFPLTKTRPPPHNSMASPESRAKLANTLREMGHKPPPNNKGTLQHKKWKKKIRATWKAKTEKLYSEWKERLITSLRKNGHKRTETAQDVGISVNHLTRLMNRFVKEDPEFKKEFWSPEISMKLKEASCRKTRKKNRLKFIKDNKHLILQAYHQNDKLDHKAAKNFNVQTRTFTKWREEVEKL